MKAFLKKYIRDSWGLSNENNRNKFVKNWISGLKKESKLLDAGAGIQRYREYATHLKYVSQDFGEYSGGEEFGNLESPVWNSLNCDILCDITKMPLEDCSFDNVLCTEVLEHLTDPQDALRELSRVLKTNGQMLITAPFRSIYHQEPYFFYSGFSKYWYEHFAQKNNLKIIRIIKNGNYFEDIAQEILRINSFGGTFFKIINTFFSLPYIIYLYCIDMIFKAKSPTSCWGYHVLFKKVKN